MLKSTEFEHEFEKLKSKTGVTDNASDNLKLAEITLKHLEQKANNSWKKSPFLAPSITAFSIVLVACLTSIFQGQNNLAQEDKKLQASLIIKAFETDSLETAVRNINFLVRAKLIDREVIDNIIENKKPPTIKAEDIKGVNLSSTSPTRANDSLRRVIRNQRIQLTTLTDSIDKLQREKIAELALQGIQFQKEAQKIGGQRDGLWQAYQQLRDSIDNAKKESQ